MGLDFLNILWIIVPFVVILIMIWCKHLCKNQNENNASNNHYPFETNHLRRQESSLPISMVINMPIAGASPTAPTLEENIEDQNIKIDDQPPTYEEAMNSNNVTKISLDSWV